ncbi:MAG: helix-turn-helix domain-containing protein [Candidatus Pacearchaeota archaeon]|jgi:sugar-specific transcriptional regulator TrmB
MEKDTQILEKIGLTKGEIKVYFSLIELGESSSGAVIIKSHVSRSKVYEILERLKEKGLASEVIKQNIRYFQAANPEVILEYIKNKEKELKQQEEDFKKILPSLEEKQKFKEEKQEVKVFTGFEGVKTFWNWLLERLTKKDEYLAMTFPKEALENESIIYMFQDFHKKRAEKGINAKILSSEKEEIIKKRMNFSQTKFYEFRSTKHILPTGIVIAGDVVSTFNWGKTPRVFAIVCKENADQYRKFFYDIWKETKK